MQKWIVEPNAVGGWDVRTTSVDARLFRSSARAEAEEWVRRAAAPGDIITVTDGRGSVLATSEQPGRVGAPKRARARSAPAPGRAAQSPPVPPVPPVRTSGTPGPSVRGQGRAVPPPPQAAGAPGLAERLDTGGERWNHALEILLPIGAAAGTSVVSPVVADAGGNWLLVFLGTLTWSLGLAIGTYVIVTERLQGWNAVAALAAAFVGASLVASFVGFGILEVDVLGTAVSHPLLRVVAAFAGAAVLTYGWLGAVLSGGIGLWAGWEFARKSGSG